MSEFMQPQIVYGDWWELDGGFIEFLQADLYDDPLEYGSLLFREDETSRFSAILLELQDYLDQDPDDINVIEKRKGWGARLSAPGYMDRTEWSVFDTKEEAVKYLEENYDVEFDDE